MDRYSPRRSLYSGPNSFVDSDEVSHEIGLQNAESFLRISWKIFVSNLSHKYVTRKWNTMLHVF